MASIGVGATAPDFTKTTQNGDPISLSQFRGQQTVVLYFYPKDETPGCTAEACSFRDNAAVFKNLNAEVWGISGDDGVSHRRFATRHNLEYPLLSDKNNALRRSMNVPKAMGLLPGRVTYVVDGEGVIRHVFSNLLDGPAHVREAERIISTLQA